MGRMQARLAMLGLLIGTATSQHQVDETGFPTRDAIGGIFDFKDEDAMWSQLQPLLHSKHAFIGLWEPECKDLFMDDKQNDWFVWGSVRNTDPALVALARVPRSAAPALIRDAGLPAQQCASVVYVPMIGSETSDLQVFDSTASQKPEMYPYMTWAAQRFSVGVTFRNVGNKPVSVYWLAENGRGFTRKHAVGHLTPGGQTSINSWVSHMFYVMEDSSDELVDWFSLARGGVWEVGPWKEVECTADKVCEDRHVAGLRYAYQVWYRHRMGSNVLQPSDVPAFTSTGFEKHRLPKELYKPLRDYWETRQDEIMEETLVGPAINQLDVPTQILVYPDRMKEVLFQGVRPLLEKWSGHKLESTACYGIRKYVNGSRLLMHVDTIDTHAVSGIINVHQDPNAVWPLHILDHEGNVHIVTMEPGDIVYYESAKLLHGRPEPLRGSHYSNIFIHFKPVDGWNPKRYMNF